jgi:hypothetical protein
MNKLYSWGSRTFLFVCILLLSSASFAQQKEVEMADVMRSNGKIYVVVAVCLIILVGLFLYVAGIDRKIRKMEKDV